jgi:hypothetical protein
MLGLFRDSSHCVTVKTTADAMCFLLDCGLGRSAEFEGNGQNFSTGIHPLQSGVCFEFAGLATCAELRLKFSILSAVCLSSLRSIGDHGIS